jgi:hypothetical protein
MHQLLFGGRAQCREVLHQVKGHARLVLPHTKLHLRLVQLHIEFLEASSRGRLVRPQPAMLFLLRAAAG